MNIGEYVTSKGILAEGLAGSEQFIDWEIECECGQMVKKLIDAWATIDELTADQGGRWHDELFNGVCNQISIVCCG